MRWVCVGVLLVLGSSECIFAQLSAIYAFSGSDGAWARGSLTIDGNILYGETSLGGANNAGTIFSLSTDGTAPATSLNWLYSFDAPLGSGQSNDGDMPHHNALLLVDGSLYGAALYGGNQDNPPTAAGLSTPPPPYERTGNGALFSIRTDGSGYSVLHTFSGWGNAPPTQDGANPHSPFLLYPGSESAYAGMAYGLTANGGANNQGALYSFSLAAPAETYQVIYSFSAATGYQSHGMLTTGSSGSRLLGMTRYGGAGEGGVIFSYDLADPVTPYQVLHNFEGGVADGMTNDHGFLLRLNDTLYGTTEFGGLYNEGVVFSIKEDGSDFSILHHFGNVEELDGRLPFGSLTLVNGVLYGTASKGGWMMRALCFP